MLGLTPAQTWALTGTELAACADGFERRREDDMMRRAWEMSHLYALAVGKRVTPAELLGRARAREEVDAGDTSLVAKLRLAHRRANFHDI